MSVFNSFPAHAQFVNLPCSRSDCFAKVEGDLICRNPHPNHDQTHRRCANQASKGASYGVDGGGGDDERSSTHVNSGVRPRNLTICFHSYPNASFLFVFVLFFLILKRSLLNYGNVSYAYKSSRVYTVYTNKFHQKIQKNCTCTFSSITSICEVSS